MTIRSTSLWILTGLVLVASLLSAAATPLGAAAKTADPLDAEAFFFALSVKDVDESAAWYSRVLGFETVREIGHKGKARRIHLLRREGAFLELTQGGFARSLYEVDPTIEKRYLLHGVFKIGFRVDDLEVTQARLEKLKVPLRGHVITEDDGSMRSLQIEDPDGNVIQIFQVLELPKVEAKPRSSAPPDG